MIFFLMIGQNQFNEESILSSENGARASGNLCCKKMSLNSYFIWHAKFNLRWMVDLNVYTSTESFEKKTLENVFKTLKEANIS